MAALWFFLTRTPARVIISSSSESQLVSILWSEIQQLIRSSKLRLPLVNNHLSIKKLMPVTARSSTKRPARCTERSAVTSS